MSTELLSQYPRQEYDNRAKVPLEKIPMVMAQLKALRQADDNIYLRSGSLNIMNGLIGLTFSCEGSHYISVDEFLNHDLGYWVGQSSEQQNALQNTTPN